MSRRLAPLACALATLSGPAAAQEPPETGSHIPRRNTAPRPAAGPDWVRKPTAAQFKAAVPARAVAESREGAARMRCEVTPAGELTACTLLAETPQGYGFGAALLTLAPLFALKPAKAGAARPPVEVTNSFVEHLFDTPPNWLRKPSGAQVVALIPAKAARAGKSGRVVIRCAVNERGALELCSVVEETPPDLDYGAAALALSSSFLMTPALKDGRPVRSTVSVPINFILPGVMAGSVDSVIRQPTFSAAPDAAAVFAAYPKRGRGEGLATLRCRIREAGALKDCEVVSQTPPGQGFGDAARSLSGRFRLSGDAAALEKAEGSYVAVPFHFSAPAAPPLGAVREARWITGLDPEKVLALYPEAAAAKGVKTGVGVADCLVAADGALGDCRVSREDPAGEGFGAAALQVAKVMRMSTWSTGGEPTTGRRVALPIRFNLSDPAPPAK